MSEEDKMPAKNNRKHWFQPVRGSYLPLSWQGWLLYVPYLVLLIGGFFWIQHYTASYGFTALLYVPWAVSWAVVFQWLAARL